MPRQIRVPQLKRDLAIAGKKFTRTTEKPVYSAGCKELGGVGTSAVGAVKVAQQAFSTAGIAQQPDRGMDAKDMSLALLSSLGVGLAPEITTGANFSLQMLDSDTTIIPNARIVDIKTINRKSLGSKLILATDKFKSTLDPFYVADQCPPDSSVNKDYKAKKMRQANTLSLSYDLLKMQRLLPPRLMMTEFKIIYGYNQDR